MQIALFGTSADPPTLGHQTILQWLAQHYDYCAVWVSNNPFKHHQADLNHRVEMLRLAIETMQPYLNNLQLHQELSYSRTLHTVEQARQLWSQAEFTLVVGSDLIRQLPSWYRASELLAQVKLLVIPRPGYEMLEAAIENLRHQSTEVAIAELQVPDTSSSAYREHGEMLGLNSVVANYINREHLYRWQEAENAIH